MKRVARALIRLYPATWRERYGDEFEALLEDTPVTFSGVFDLLKGAIRMQLNVPAFPKLAVLLSVAGLLTGLGVSFRVPSRYISTAALEFDGRLTPQDSRPDLYRYLLQLENESLTGTSLSTIIQDPNLDLYKRDRSRMPLEDVIENMRKDIRIQIVGRGDPNREYLAFQVSFTYRDRMKAQETVQALITKFMEVDLTRQRVAGYVQRGSTYDEVDRMEQRIAAVEKRLGINTPPPTAVDLPHSAHGLVPPDARRLDVLDPPSLAMHPIYPNRSAFMLTGFGAGFAAALVVAIFRRKLPAIPFTARTA